MLDTHHLGLTDRTKMLPTSKLIKVVVVRINSLQTKQLNINLPESLLLIFFSLIYVMSHGLGKTRLCREFGFKKLFVPKRFEPYILLGTIYATKFMAFSPPEPTWFN
jgi:hypothetical protein